MSIRVKYAVNTPSARAAIGSYFSYQKRLVSDIPFVTCRRGGQNILAKLDVYSPFELNWAGMEEKITELFFGDNIETKMQELVESIVPLYNVEIVPLIFGYEEYFGSITPQSFYAHSKKRDNDLILIKIHSLSMIFKIELTRRS
jgi:hypothetical protein